MIGVITLPIIGFSGPCTGNLRQLSSSSPAEDWNTAHSLHKALPIFQVVENIFCATWPVTVFLFGGNSNIFNVHPDPWGFMIQFDLCIFFKWVRSTTNYLFFSVLFQNFIVNVKNW